VTNTKSNFLAEMERTWPKLTAEQKAKVWRKGMSTPLARGWALSA
jgi:hypothetical protein